MTTDNPDKPVATEDQTLVTEPTDENYPPEVTEDGGEATTAEVTTAPAEAPVVEAPVETPTVEEAPAPVPTMTDAERTHVQGLEAQNAQYAQQVETARQAEEYRTTLANLVDTQGLTDTQAQFVASQIQTANQRARQAEAVATQQIQYNQNKTAAAAEYAKTYGIPPQDLMVFDSRDAMIAHAKLWQISTKNTEDISKLTKSQVPAQNFENGQATVVAPTDRESRMEYLATKATDWTEAESAEYLRLMAIA